MRQVLAELPRAWLSIELPGYRPHPRPATYSAFEVAALPPVPPDLDPELRWLLAEPPVPSSLAEGDPEERESGFSAERLHALLEGCGADVPTALAILVRSREAQARVRSCTGCYLDLADAAVAIPGGLLVHFLVDSQWLLHWLLYVGGGGEEAVVVTPLPLGFPELCDTDTFDPRSAATARDDAWDVAGSAAVCAPTLVEFLYRFRTENEIWFACARGDRPLRPDERRYAEHYGRSS